MHRSKGFTLLELAVVLVVMGTLGLLGVYGFDNIGETRARSRAVAEGEQIREALRNFLITNKRLPCPDTDGKAREICSGGAVVGWVPYETIGLSPVPRLQRAIYGVYRNGSAQADLATLGELTGDSEGDANYESTGDAVEALINAQKQTKSSSYVYVTGEGGRHGSADCNANVVSNPAYAIALPVNDKDGNGSGLDGPHLAPGSTIKCFASPLGRVSNTYDDVVVADPPSVLIGWLAALPN